MRNPLLPALLAALALLPGAGCARAQPGAARELVIAEDFLDLLRDRFDLNSPLKGKAFERLVLTNRVTVIVIDAQKGVVRVCRRAETELTPWDLDAADLGFLRDFATEKAFGYLRTIRGALASSREGAPLPEGAKKQVQQLAKRINELPPERRREVSLLVGAGLADLKPADRELSEYVAAFRGEVERRALKSLPPAEKVRPGHPLVYGSGGVTKAALESIRDRDVKRVTVNGHPYAYAWAGRTLILVPQQKGKGPRPTHPLGLDPEVHGRVKTARPGTTVFKGFPLRRR